MHTVMPSKASRLQERRHRWKRKHHFRQVSFHLYPEAHMHRLTALHVLPLDLHDLNFSIQSPLPTLSRPYQKLKLKERKICFDQQLKFGFQVFCLRGSSLGFLSFCEGREKDGCRKEHSCSLAVSEPGHVFHCAGLCQLVCQQVYQCPDCSPQ